MALPIIVNPIPVLPPVPSTIILLSIFFSFSISFIIYNAALSFMDCPGFKNSALPKILHCVISDAFFNLINGVLPTSSIILSEKNLLFYSFLFLGFLIILLCGLYPLTAKNKKIKVHVKHTRKPSK